MNPTIRVLTERRGNLQDEANAALDEIDRLQRRVSEILDYEIPSIDRHVESIVKMEWRVEAVR